MTILKKLQEAGIDFTTHTLTLYSDAKARTRRFAITDVNGNGLWYGREFEEIEQSACELSAACKAVYLAGLARKTAGIPAFALELILNVDAQWLTYFRGKNKAAPLKRDAEKQGIKLHVNWIPGNENPADDLTVSGGYCKSADNLEQVLLLVTEVVQGNVTDA
jgi:hypothetical protein